MPKRNKKTSVVVNGSDLHAHVIANGTMSITVNVDCTLAARLANAAKAFEFYCFEELTLEILPHVYVGAALTSSTDQILAVGYVPEYTNATLTTLTAGDVMEQEASKCVMANAGTYSTGGHNVSTFLRVPKRVLRAAPVKMWRTQAVLTEDPEITQGIVVFARAANAGSNTHIVNVVYRYRVRFFGQEQTAAITSALRKGRVAAVASDEQKDEDELSDEDSVVQLSPPKLVRVPSVKIPKRP